ncbi:MAG TPA: response regulator [Candidatus Binataceae bacterium]
MSVRVLIADSSGLRRDIIRQHLQCLGCAVVAEAATALHALNLFRTVRPDVVALEAELPRAAADDAELDGLALFRAIHQEAPATAVLMLSAADAAETSRSFLREGALDCIVEPFDRAGFARMWRSLAAVYPELGRGDLAAGSPPTRRRA